MYTFNDLEEGVVLCSDDIIQSIENITFNSKLVQDHKR